MNMWYMLWHKLIIRVSERVVS